MRRREFIAALGSAVALPVVARAQQSRQKPLIGVSQPAPVCEGKRTFSRCLSEGLAEYGSIIRRDKNATVD